MIGCEVVFYCCVEVEKVYGEDVGVIVDLVGYYLLVVEGDIVVEYFIFYGGINFGKQFGYWVKMGVIFVV